MESPVTVEAICSAPGKVILFGEHAVVYGVTALAACLSDLRVFVNIATSHDRNSIIILEDLQGDDGEVFQFSTEASSMSMFTEANSAPLKAINPSTEIIQLLRETYSHLSNQPSQCIMSIAFLIANMLPEFVKISTVRGLRIHIKSVGLPLGAGLGSSAAFSVALAGAILRIRNIIFQDVDASNISAFDQEVEWTPPYSVLEVLNAWAYTSEVVIHGEPSGLDNTSSCFGGAVKFKRGSPFERIEKFPEINILLTNTKSPRSTKVLVAKVRQLYDALPDVVKPLLSAIEGITMAALQLVESAAEDIEFASSESFLNRLSILFTMNHNLLCGLGVGHSTLTSVFEASQIAGLASKLTGAGGGGCAITLLRSTSSGTSEDHGTYLLKVQQLKESLQLLGFEYFSSTVGGPGVKWHTQKLF